MNNPVLNLLVQILSVVLGGGAVGGGIWKFARAILERALADRKLKESLVNSVAELVRTMQAHDARLTRLERKTDVPAQPAPAQPAPAQPAAAPAVGQ